ncbi:MAG: FadR/GntR family transcriptional regulator [Rikenellaceae bacterium]
MQRDRKDRRGAKPVIINGSVAVQIADILTRRIIDQSVVVGDFLPTEELLCEEFGVGRSSIREAIKTLESRGLVRKRQGRGAVVVDESIEATSRMLKLSLDYKKSSLRDVVQFRETMETKLAELAALCATPDDIEQMQRYLDLMKFEPYKPKRFAEYDYSFHEAIAKASKNSVAVLILQALRPILYDQISYTLKNDFNPELVNHLHEEIFTAICNRQPITASKLMMKHIEETHRIVSATN